jgi:hypothetical protein
VGSVAAALAYLCHGATADDVITNCAQHTCLMQVAALAPKIEAMEASWNRLRAISGAETPNEVVEYWQGEKSIKQQVHAYI